MAQIILDFGSGNTCHNDKKYIKKMYDELEKIYTGKHGLVVKWQLFEKAGKNEILQPDSFDYAYEYGKGLGYEVTASVFDKNSLDFLLDYDVPFVKIANNRQLDWLIGEIPRNIPVYISYGNAKELNERYKFAINNLKALICVSEYPAKIEQYDKVINFYGFMPECAVSDHTTNFGIWYRYQPDIIEWHYKLSDSTGLDAGDFARTPQQLAEVL